MIADVSLIDLTRKLAMLMTLTRGGQQVQTIQSDKVSENSLIKIFI